MRWIKLYDQPSSRCSKNRFVWLQLFIICCNRSDGKDAINPLKKEDVDQVALSLAVIWLSPLHVNQDDNRNLDKARKLDYEHSEIRLCMKTYWLSGCRHDMNLFMSRVFNTSSLNWLLSHMDLKLLLFSKSVIFIFNCLHKKIVCVSLVHTQNRIYVFGHFKTWHRSSECWRKYLIFSTCW